MNEISNEFTDSSAEKNSKPQGIVDRLIAVNMVWCEFLVVAMMLVIAVDVFTRLTLNYSWQMSDEISGYLLVALVFCSLAGGMRDKTFLRVDFLFIRFSARAQRTLDGIYGVLGLVFVSVWTWQLSRQVLSSYTRGMESNSAFPIPIWIPQLAMPVGAAFLCIVMLRGSWTWLHGATKEKMESSK